MNRARTRTKPAPRHTPGPWNYSKQNAPWVDTPTGWADGQTIAYMPREHASCEANARLIAAAPELLQAVQRLVDTNIPKPRL